MNIWYTHTWDVVLSGSPYLVLPFPLHSFLPSQPKQPPPPPSLSSCLGWYHPFSATLARDALAWESAGCCLVATESLQTSSCPLNPISPSPTSSAWINHVYSAFFDLHCHYAQDPLFFCGSRSSAHLAGIVRSPSTFGCAPRLLSFCWATTVLPPFRHYTGAHDFCYHPSVLDSSWSADLSN